MLAIRHEAISAKLGIIHARGISNPAGLAETGTQWSRSCFNAGQSFSFRVALQSCAEFAQSLQFLEWKISSMGHGRVAYRSNVAIRQYQSISFRPVRISVIVIENMEIKGRKHIRHAQWSCGMPTPRLRQ